MTPNVDRFDPRRRGWFLPLGKADSDDLEIAPTYRQLATRSWTMFRSSYDVPVSDQDPILNR